MRKQKLVVFGYGRRGGVYAAYAVNFPQEFELVAIIENDPKRRALASRNCAGAKIYDDYHAFIADKVEADAVAVATQDGDHCEHALAMLEAGYDLLLEKPIAPTEAECREICAAAKRLNRRVVVCHVLRYTPFYSTIKRIIDSGTIGDVVTINASENVGYYHQAHSYVRGPWRNTAESSPMILAKCCHDLDMLRYLIGEKCESVSSYGGLYYFNAAHAPENHAALCSECRVPDCIYRAQTLYTREGLKEFARYFTTDELTDENILRDLKGTQYDRCVYACDNDVVDHQVVNAAFAGGKTASLTMTAFSSFTYRDIKVHGTKAELYGKIENNQVEIRYFGKDWVTVPTTLSDDAKRKVFEHNGGDFGIMQSFYKFLNGEQADGVSLLDVSLDSHLMCFAAEQSRLTGKTVKLK